MVVSMAPTMRTMSKRIAATILWFFAGWYLGGYIALFLGVSDVIGPVLGVSTAAIFGGDPLGIIWRRRTSGSAHGIVAGAVIEELADAA